MTTRDLQIGGAVLAVAAVTDPSPTAAAIVAALLLLVGIAGELSIPKDPD